MKYKFLLFRAGGTQRLLWLIGPAKTKELIFAAEIIDADYAKMLGNQLLISCLFLSFRYYQSCSRKSDRIVRSDSIQNSSEWYLFKMLQQLIIFIKF